MHHTEDNLIDFNEKCAESFTIATGMHVRIGARCSIMC